MNEKNQQTRPPSADEPQLASSAPWTADEWVSAMPVEMRGHVFHLLGKALGHKTGAQTNDVGDDGDSGGNGPKHP